MRKRTHHSRVGARKRTKLKKWSGKVTRESHALELENGVFKKRSAHDIARSLKRSAEHSHERKSVPLRSAMSMLTFYINRAGKNMSAGRKRTLEAAKGELRRLFA
jgi:hypothetical protein